MNINILSIGKFSNSIFKDSYFSYKKRLSYNVNLKELEIKKANNLSITQIIAKEGDLLLGNLQKNSYIIALDERAQQYQSAKFADFLQDVVLKGFSAIDFIIGGANGLDYKVLDKSHQKISLSKMTLPHMMVRTILIEQIYRAQCILNNHPYHK